MQRYRYKFTKERKQAWNKKVWPSPACHLSKDKVLTRKYQFKQNVMKKEQGAYLQMSVERTILM